MTRLFLSYIVRFLLILAAKTLIFQLEDVCFRLSEEIDGKEERTLIMSRVSGICVKFSYASDEQFLVNLSIDRLQFSFKPECDKHHNNMEFFATKVTGCYKFPGKTDLTNAIFRSSAKVEVDHLSGSFKDSAFIEFIQFPQKSLMIKQLRRALGFQFNPAEHLIKFKSELLANDIIKVVI